MKWALLVFFLPSICVATEDKLVSAIKVRCDFLNEKISFDIREDCMTHYVNCGVKFGGKIEMEDLDECVDKARESK